MQSSRALDLGCGRGEWLELTEQWGFDGQGVDLSEGMLEACRQRGLKVERDDALQKLHSMAPGSLVLITAFHLIEHIPFDQVRELIDASRHALCPGGLLILETPNPENLIVGATNFYLDPTHIRPVPPLLLSFATEHAGFTRNKVVRLQQPELAPGRLGISDVLGAVSPDYSVICQKAADSDVMQRFDVAFEGEHGVSLESLAHDYDARWVAKFTAYDSQIDIRMRQMHAHARQADARARQARIWAQNAEARSDLTEFKLSEATALLLRIEQQLGVAQAHLHAVLESNSWRLTAPLRALIKPARRLTHAAREGRLGSGIKRRIKSLIRATAAQVNRRPLLKRSAHRILNCVPPLKRRLAAMLAPVQAAAWTDNMTQAPDTLSPDACAILRQLKQSQRGLEKI
ncbi:O-antigen chain-terminating methyltransferase [Variovorax sp. YR634]|nr:O-antigen chain-terminating methyltransferase [Variovorax sp. YR634]